MGNAVNQLAHLLVARSPDLLGLSVVDDARDTDVGPFLESVCKPISLSRFLFRTPSPVLFSNMKRPKVVSPQLPNGSTGLYGSSNS